MPDPLRQLLPAAEPAVLDALDSRPAVADALGRILRYSPVYRAWLERFPDLLRWLNDGCRPDGRPFGPGRYAQNRELFEADCPAEAAPLNAFRRLHSLRILLRQCLHAAPMDSLLREISDLADHTLSRHYETVLQQHIERFGQPWDEQTDRPAGCILIGLGKLGGRELNFFSDVDLLFCFSGAGFTRRGTRPTRLRNREFFHKVASAFCQRVQQTTPSGQLYRVDLRLRPDGDQGPLVPSLDGMMRYYYERGQTWERLCLLKARRIAGPRELAHEWQEMLQQFRYPRFAPAHYAEEVALLKSRTEQEGRQSAHPARDLKNGQGGIREVEFFTQTLQLIHGARFPFLQTPSTMEALRQLGRYELLPHADAHNLRHAYAFLRRIENLLQAREEMPVHHLPADPESESALAQCMALPESTPWTGLLQQHRARIHQHFNDLFPREPRQQLKEDWLALFSDKPVGPHLSELLRKWFGQRHRQGEQALRALATDRPGRPVSREELTLFANMADPFSDAFARCADPVRTVRRIAAFVETYASRRQFLQTGQQHPHFIRLLALLFDRSSRVFEILRRQPAIMEELLTRAGHRHLDTEAQLKAIRLGPAHDFPAWLRLYLNAEFVRILGNELLEIDPLPALQAQLTALAEAACRALLKALHPDCPLLLVALGKFGTRELTPGSDLDVLALSPDSLPSHEAASALQDLARNLAGSGFRLDLRLRPHGEDGALAISLDRFRHYYRHEAMDWERHLLTRARPFAGPSDLLQAFTREHARLLYHDPAFRPTAQHPPEDPDLRRRRLAEKLPSDQPHRSLKHAPGGLLDLELQIALLCRRHGHAVPRLQQPASAGLLPTIAQAGLLTREKAQTLLQNYRFLRHLQLCLRRDAFAPVDQIPASSEDQHRLARWAGLPSAEHLLSEVRQRLAQNLAAFPSPLPPT